MIFNCFSMLSLCFPVVNTQCGLPQRGNISLAWGPSPCTQSMYEPMCKTHEQNTPNPKTIWPYACFQGNHSSLAPIIGNFMLQSTISMQSLSQLVNTYQQYHDASGVNGSPKELYAPVDYIMGLSGKRARPVLCLAANQMFGGDMQQALPLVWPPRAFSAI